MMNAWHREEPRDVRPFFQAVKAETALSQSAILLFEGAEPSTETVFDLDESEFQKLALTVRPSLIDPAEWMPAGIVAGDLELVLVASHSFLKKSIVVDRYAVGEQWPAEWPIDSELTVELGGGRNAQVTLALCLSKDREPSPGSPFIVGAWIARKTFTLRAKALPTLFDVRTRSDDEWLAAGYPPKTLFAVDYAGGMELEAEEGSSIATVYLHIDAHNKMAASPAGGMLQPLLASEIIATILQASLEDWKAIEAAPPGSPLAKVLKQFGKPNPLNLSELKALVAAPSKLRAELQDRLGVVRAII